MGFFPSQTPPLGGSMEEATQEMPAYVYEKYLKPKQFPNMIVSADERTASRTTASPHTYSQGDTGHVDLLQDFHSGGPAANENGHSGNDMNEEIYAELNYSPKAPQFPPPETPAVVGKKRNYKGEVLSSSATPGPLTNPLAHYKAGLGPVMGLSQVFEATQAASSPNINGFNSDPISGRPSPDVHNPSRSPNALIFSSPSKTERSYPQRATTEPRTTYVSMLESQEQRTRLEMLQQISSPMAGDGSDSSEDDFSSRQSLRARVRRQKTRDDEEFRRVSASITAPPRGFASRRAGIKGGVVGKSSTNLASPGFVGHEDTGQEEAVFISDDLGLGPVEQGILGNITEDETDLEQEAVHHTTQHREEEKENFSDTISDRPLRRSDTTFYTNAGSPLPKTRSTTPLNNPTFHNDRDLADDSDDMAKNRADDLAIDNSSDLPQKMDTNPFESENFAVADSQPRPPHSEFIDPHDSVLPMRKALQSSPAFRMESHQNPSEVAPQPSISANPALTINGSSPIPPPPFSSSHAPETSPVIVYSPPRQGITETLKVGSSKVAKNVGELSSPDKLDLIIGQSSLQSASSNMAHPVGSAPKMPTSTSDRRDSAQKATAVEASLAATSYKNNLTKEAITLESDGTSTPLPSKTTSIDASTTIPETSPAGDYNHSSPISRASLGKRASSNPLPKHHEHRINLEKSYDTITQLPHASSGNQEFETAKTHLGSNASKDALQSKCHDIGPHYSAHSPSKKRTRTLTEIAADPSPSTGFDDVDTDANLLTMQDLAFQAAMDRSSPIGPKRKRRRVTTQQNNQRTEQGAKQAHALHPPAAEEPRIDLGHSTPSNSNVNVQDDSSLLEVEQSGRSETINHSRKKPNVLKKTVASQAKQSVLRTSKTTDRQQSKTHSTVANSSGVSVATHNPTSSKVVADILPITSANREGTRNGSAHLNEPPILQMTNAESTFSLNRVFALFRGGKLNYYPATCVGFGGAKGSQLKIRFDDGTLDNSLDKQHVRRLEMRAGDVVKVDLPNMRTKNYVVHGFKDREQLHREPTTSTKVRQRSLPKVKKPSRADIFGFDTVLLAPKQREIITANESTVQNDMISVPTASVYLTQTMWNHFNDRVFTHTVDESVSSSGLHTPVERSCTPATPTSRSRRLPTLPFGQGSRSMSSLGSFMPSSGLFKSMAFAVTSTGLGTEKSRIVDCLLNHGARVLADGFEELFDVGDPIFAATSTDGGGGGPSSDLRLTAESQKLGFTCLIADQHSRSAKYMQALALGLPCLAARWVDDCVAKNRILHWEPYLLPSGKSDFLGGAVRSRTLPSYSANTASLSSTIESRQKLLDGRSVLLVMGKGKAQTYFFLTHTLGASRVSQVTDFNVAEALIGEAEGDEEAWDWVYVDDKEMDVEKTQSGRRRKSVKNGGNTGSMHQNGEILKAKAKVVGNEFVIQSLILGRLLEEE
ncbi:MAG: hypothetical protein M1827_000131 [Pycnora praestabilis]|nr:MAG: hypothetical protein M1827_000131 [Pycnora praestabilis]